MNEIIDVFEKDKMHIYIEKLEQSKNNQHNTKKSNL